MNDPWAFGWTQLLTIIGFCITVTIALGSFRTFGRWKREKIEEKRLDVALEALSVAYEAQMVFEDIQRPYIGQYEWQSMPDQGMDKEEKERRQPIYAVINRLDRHVSYFERVLSLQPKFMAVFGSETKNTFTKLYRARNGIQAAVEALMFMDHPIRPDEEGTVAQMRSDIWNTKGPAAIEPERTKKLVLEFQSDIERICGPLVNREFDVKRTKTLSQL
ncbi:hypothetical protein [Bradyrhizobium sp. CCBAU 051011]|uniref:hypothetical protein n=1 Tax=Bradyrhizobium sp. CCBAU 051011 TaxID=858422 RepID=UPI00137989B2|nr:hypothetical protein [Bradyrhizobium sp. CCBAU 051011]